jgi:hypothetical protein
LPKPARAFALFLHADAALRGVGKRSLSKPVSGSKSPAGRKLATVIRREEAGRKGADLIHQLVGKKRLGA